MYSVSGCDASIQTDDKSGKTMILKYRKTVTIPLYSTCSCLEVIGLNSSCYLSNKIIFHIIWTLFQYCYYVCILHAMTRMLNLSRILLMDNSYFCSFWMRGHTNIRPPATKAGLLWHTPAKENEQTTAWLLRRWHSDFWRSFKRSWLSAQKHLRYYKLVSRFSLERYWMKNA